MPSFPPNWIARTLEASGVPATSQSIAVLRAWRKSTPLPPLSNNPLGMPVHSSGAPAYLNTGYAIFPSMTAFYAAFVAWSKSAAGKKVLASLNDSDGYGAAWRAISVLPWPASKTETDYPAHVLDLASESYRESVNASPASDRRTSGTVGGLNATAQSVVQQAALLNVHAAAIKDGSMTLAQILRRA